MGRIKNLLLVGKFKEDNNTEKKNKCLLETDESSYQGNKHQPRRKGK